MDDHVRILADLYLELLAERARSERPSVETAVVP
jgi:hypothetical protein